MKKITSFLLITLFLLGSLPLHGFAFEVARPEPPIVLHYERAMQVSATLAKRNNKAICSGRVDSKYMTDSIAITMILKKKNGTSWDYYDSWSGSGTGFLTVDGESSISSGRYKLFVYGTITSRGGDSESVNKESVEIVR